MFDGNADFIYYEYLRRKQHFSSTGTDISWPDVISLLWRVLMILKRALSKCLGEAVMVFDRG